MAEENQEKIETTTTPVVGDQGVEVKERGYFDFLRTKKEEKPQEEAIASEFGEKVKVSETEHKPVEHKEEEEKEKQHGSLFEKLRRTSSSSSSSDEEEGEGEEKKKKKKEKKHAENVTIPVEKVDEPVPEEKKGFLDVFKEKLPGKKTEEVPPSPPPISLSTESAATTEAVASEGEVKEQKGFVLDEIKEKIPRTPPSTESSAATTEAVAREGEAKEEKGFLDKIKERTPPNTPSTESTATTQAAHEGEAKEKKGFLEKIKEKIPHSTPPSTESAATTEAANEGEAKEKKGFLDKIKGKIPGYHAKTEEEKEKEKDSAAR